MLRSERVSALTMFAFAWKENLFAVIPTIKRAATIPVRIMGGVDARGVQFRFVAGCSLIVMIPPVLIALFARRYIVRGPALGAVKGRTGRKEDSHGLRLGSKRPQILRRCRGHSWRVD